jgi:hypothetical protein
MTYNLDWKERLGNENSFLQLRSKLITKAMYVEKPK